MTPVSQPTLPNQVQRIAADISARLAQAAKDPPDLAVYFRQHADCIVPVLQPVGLSYEMATGQTFQRAFSINHDSLKLREAPAQELAFQRAVRNTAANGKTVFLDANSTPTHAAHGLRPEDAPAPETLPLHNQTPYQQIFVPIPLNKKPVGVLHAWFNPADANVTQARVVLLAHAAAEIELYLKARRITDISQELSRINTYAHFLEDVAGDQDLDSVAWKLVNYAREAVGCDRVCLMVDSRYGLARANGLPPSERFELQACSGLRRPHARSEHADVLKAHASELLKMAVTVPAGDGAKKDIRQQASTAADGTPDAPPADAKATKETNAAANGQPASTQPDARPKMRIIFTMRDPAKVATRPDAVNRYFEVIPMNWATVLPLYDRENRVCGTLLFEGQQTNEKMAGLFAQMRDLAVSGGRALSTAMVWDRRRALRGARVLMGWRDALLSSSRRRLFLKYGVPLMLVVGLLAFPFRYRIRADAMLRPVRVQTIAALTSGRLVEVNVREGARVAKDDVLCVLDSADLKFQLSQAEEERRRISVEAAVALREQNSAARMQIARNRAQEIDVTISRLKRDIELTVVKAPFDGILVGPQDLMQRKGQVVRVGDTVAEVVDPSKWEVKISIREEDVPTITSEVNQRRAVDPNAAVEGELVLMAEPDRVYPLRLTDPSTFSHQLDTANGNYNFSAVVPLAGHIEGELTPGGELKTGYTGRARFSCGRRPLAQILFGDFIRFLKVTFF